MVSRRHLFVFALVLGLAAYGLSGERAKGPFRAFGGLGKGESAAAPSPNASALALAESSPLSLYQKLFKEGVPENELLAAAAERFARPYQPGDQKEAHARLVLLQAFGRFPVNQEMRALARRVVEQPEHLLVRREALRYLQPTLGLMTEAERGALLADLPPAVISLADKSDVELIAALWSAPRGARRPQQQERSLNEWESLPCPSPQQFAWIATQLNWEVFSYACDLSPAGKLGRLLWLLNSLQLPTEGLPEPMASHLKDPFAFLAERTGKLVVDLTLDPLAVAQNQLKLRRIRLGPAFFSNPPLESLATLIHEARHSDPGESMLHSTCVQGDISGIEGGCDARLSQDAKAGSYSYEVFFQLALARSGVASAADKVFLENTALFLVAGRFNQLPLAFAHFQDGLAALDEEGNLRLLHPFAKALLAPQGLPAESYARLAYHEPTGGLLLFRPGRPARLWSWDESKENAYERVVGTERLSTAFAGRVHVPEQEFPSHVLLDENNQLHYVNYDVAAFRRRLLPYPLALPFSLTEFFHGGRNRSYFLAEDGALYRLHPAARAVEEPFQPQLSEQIAFRHGDGGVLHDSVFLVGKDGVLYTQRLPDSHMDYASGPAADSLDRQDFQSGATAVEYREGTQMRALLDEEGALWLGYHGGSEPAFRITPEKKFRSFAFVKMLETHGYLALERKSRTEFAARCGLREEPALDPWFHRGVGVVKGQLLFEGDEAQCLPALLPPGAQGQVAAFRFAAQATKPGAKGATGYFSPQIMEVELRDGRKLELRPYQGWREDAN